MLRHIRTKILVLILPVVFLTVFLSLTVSDNFGKKIINSQIQEKIKAQQLAQASIIENKLDYAKVLSADVSVVVAKTYTNSELTTYEDILKEIIQKDSFVLGAGIWFEPYVYDSSEQYVGPYVYKDGKSIVTTFDYSNETYNYFSQEYYSAAKNKKSVVYSNPYYDKTSDLYMLTCSTPIMDADGNFLGCVTVDIQLAEMQKLVTSLGTEAGGSAFVLGNNGVYLATEDMSLVEDGKMITNETNKSLQQAGKYIMEEDSGMTSFEEGGVTYRLYFSTIPELNWKVVFQISDSSILSPVYELGTILLIIGVITVIVILGNILFIVARSIVKPIHVLVQEFKFIADKEYDSNVPEILMQKKDEFGILGKSLSEMKIRLKQNKKEIEDILEENIAANEELKIQNNLLKISEDNLLESMKYNQSIIQVIPDIVFILSRDGKFLDFQGSSENLLYIAKEEFIGKNIYEVMPENMARIGMQKIRDAFEKGTLQSFEYELEISGQIDYFELRIIQCFADKVVAIARRVTNQHEHLMQIEYLSYHDQLTQLYNRRYFEEEVEQLNRTESLLLLKKFAQVLKKTCDTD